MDTGLNGFLEGCSPELAERSHLREADASHVVDGVQPRYIAEPVLSEQVAELLGAASRQGAATVIRGSGSKLGWGRTPASIDLVISTRRLNRLLVHAYGDLTATVEAGMSIRQLNESLAWHGQWLPVDQPFETATVGGVIATNDAGPLRHRHGTPRDLLIGVHLATTDGRIVKAGGTVVKNVAGYDLGKLMAGSHGSLAAIVSATFKLAPLPGASATAVVPFREVGELSTAVAAVSASQLEAAAFDVRVTVARAELAQAGAPAPFQLLLRFTSTPEAIEAQVAGLRQLLPAAAIELLTGSAEIEAWRGQTRGVWGGGTIVRASWLPSKLDAVVSWLHELAHDLHTKINLTARAGVGAGFLRIGGEPRTGIEAIKRLRGRFDLMRHVVVLRADVRVKEQLDVWGSTGDHDDLLRAVKHAFDPAGVLNAGRGPV
jgi:glycolate dehydrogenase FAD-binding subunit